MTKKLNKKGTSLVELIAVIVIMGIIAAIAVPVTVGVINRQKAKAAKADVESLIAAVKARAAEGVAASTVTIVVDGGLGRMTISESADAPTAPTSSTGEAIGLDGWKCNGGATGCTTTMTFNVGAGTYTWTEVTFIMDNGYNVTVGTNGVAADAVKR